MFKEDWIGQTLDCEFTGRTVPVEEVIVVFGTPNGVPVDGVWVGLKFSDNVGNITVNF
jgi:hypothetical protein